MKNRDRICNCHQLGCLEGKKCSFLKKIYGKEDRKRRVAFGKKLFDEWYKYLSFESH